MFGKSRQAFHQMESRRIHETVNDEILLVYVKELRRQQPRIGTRKLYDMLHEVKLSNSIKIGRDKLFALLRKNDLLVKRRRKHVKTTDSYHQYRKYPNLIEGYVPSGPEQIVASDITYLSTENGFVSCPDICLQPEERICKWKIGRNRMGSPKHLRFML